MNRLRWIDQDEYIKMNILRLIDNRLVDEELSEDINIEISLSLSDGELETINNLLLTVYLVHLYYLNNLVFLFFLKFIYILSILS